MLMQGFRIIKRVLSYQKEVKGWTVMDKDMGRSVISSGLVEFSKEFFSTTFCYSNKRCVCIIYRYGYCNKRCASFIDMDIVKCFLENSMLL